MLSWRRSTTRRVDCSAESARRPRPRRASDHQSVSERRRVEKLVGAGVPSSVLRRQANVHNKEIVVDGKVVLVSSQNWSADGTLRNRDAGLIIHSADAAAYFEQIFLHDWRYLASPVGS
ncbi:phospholipase D-like domain-containing protein [Paraburkholderia fungorum]|uniref:phospholipase D-like domain-containing protein n=1 Tax=Paraburkholderia fungorum TaxID=134537 RepID=UPI0038BA0C30